MPTQFYLLQTQGNILPAQKEGLTPFESKSHVPTGTLISPTPCYSSCTIKNLGR